MYWSLDDQKRFHHHFSIFSVNSTVSLSVILPCHISLFPSETKNACQIKILDEFIIFIHLYKAHPAVALILLSVNTFKSLFDSLSLILLLSKYQARKVYRGAELYLHLFQTQAAGEDDTIPLVQLYDVAKILPIDMRHQPERYTEI